MKRIILASRSPARYQILKDAGFKIERKFADIDEAIKEKESPQDLALRLAVEKAEKISKNIANAIIITADTIIAHEQEIFGRPKNIDEAKTILQKLSGKWHTVYTGLIVTDTTSMRQLKEIISTRVKFIELNRNIIEWYISTGEPMDAAGAYQIQKKGRTLIDEINGCFTNVIGISIPAVRKMLKEIDTL